VYHFKEKGSFTLANHTILRLGELAREGLIGKTKLPLLSVYHFKERGSVISANHTILGLGELTQEGGPLGGPYYFHYWLITTRERFV